MPTFQRLDTLIGDLQDDATSIALQVAADDSIYVLSVDNESYEDADGGSTYVTGELFHLTAKGKYDTLFNGSGSLAVVQSPEFAELDPIGMAVNADGSVYVATQTNKPDAAFAEDSDVALLRVLPDGSFDSTLGADGKIIPGFGKVFQRSEGIAGTASIALAPNGDVFAGQVVTDTSIESVPAAIEVRRLDPAGNPVPSWGDAGIARTDTSFFQNQTAIQVTPDGGVLMGADAGETPAIVRGVALWPEFEQRGINESSFKSTERTNFNTGRSRSNRWHADDHRYICGRRHSCRTQRLTYLRAGQPLAI